MAIDSSAPRRGKDARGFWRVLLAIVVPLPWLAKGIQYIVYESSFDKTADQIQYDLTHSIYGDLLQWLDLLFVLLVVPSVIAMALVARRGAPRLTTVATVVMGGGFLAVLTLNNGGGGDWQAWAAAQAGVDPTKAGDLLDSLADPRQILGTIGFMLAIIVGSILIGLALWRSRAVPLWAAILIMAGGATHPFLTFEHHVHGAGLVVLAIGCAAVSARLLRMRNDEYDLPPLDRTAARIVTPVPVSANR